MIFPDRKEIPENSRFAILFQRVESRERKISPLLPQSFLLLILLFLLCAKKIQLGR